MVWAQIAMAAVNIVTGMQNASAKKRLGEAQYKYEASAADNKVMQKAAQNTLAAAAADVERANQQRSNRQAMKGLERGFESESFNYGKAVDGLNSNRFDMRMQGASALGTLAASAGAAGVGGASVANLDATERFRQERQDQVVRDQIQDSTYASALNKTSMMDNQYNSMDNSLILPGFDYSARDFVMDNRGQNKYQLSNVVTDGMNGFSGNMNQVGIKLDKDQVSGANAYAQQGINYFKGTPATGSASKGAGATRL